MKIPRVNVGHATIERWVYKFGLLFEKKNEVLFSHRCLFHL